MFGLLFLTAFLILANGFFVAAEFALVKVRKTQLDVRAANGERMAAVARELVEHLDGYLSATQLGITLTSLGLGWIGEPAVAAMLGPLFHALHLSEELSHSLAVVIGFVGISFLHIVLGEVAPKSLAIARPVQVSMAVAVLMRLFHWVFYPALIVLNASSNLLLRLVGIQEANSHSLAVPAEELVRIAAESAAGGHISEGEGEMLENVFLFTQRLAREIMVPRNRVTALDLAGDFQAELQMVMEDGHSRYPVYEGELDHLVGMLHLMDLLRVPVDERTPERVRSIVRPILFVPESLPAEKVMRRMQHRRSHLAVVIDEHGSVAGVVSLEDALEELVGEIQDEHDDDEADEIRKTDDGFALAGVLNVDELCDALGIPVFETDADTLQGWLMERLERIPVVGDEVQLPPWILRVSDVEERAVRRVDARRAPDGDTRTPSPA